MVWRWMSCLGCCIFWKGCVCFNTVMTVGAGSSIGRGCFLANPTIFFLLNSGSRQLSSFLPQIWKSKVPQKLNFTYGSWHLGSLILVIKSKGEGLPSIFLLSHVFCVNLIWKAWIMCFFIVLFPYKSGGVYLGSPAELSLKTVLISYVLSLRLWVGGRKPQLYGSAWCMLVFGLFGWNATEEFFMIIRKRVSRKSGRRLDIGLLFGLQLPQFLRIITLLSLCWI